MKELPLMMRTENVQATEKGWKTATCRQTGLDVVNAEPERWSIVDYHWHPKTKGLMVTLGPRNRKMPADYHVIPFPYQMGDLIYLKETWQHAGWNGDVPVSPAYKALGHTACGWRGGRFMPKDKARIWVKVTDTSLTRVQCLGEHAMRAEWLNIIALENGRVYWPLGVKNGPLEFMPKGKEMKDLTKMDVIRMHWAAKWSQINGRASWDRNDWVFQVSYQLYDYGGSRAAE